MLPQNTKISDKNEENTEKSIKTGQKLMNGAKIDLFNY